MSFKENRKLIISKTLLYDWTKKLFKIDTKYIQFDYFYLTSTLSFKLIIYSILLNINLSVIYQEILNI